MRKYQIRINSNSHSHSRDSSQSSLDCRDDHDMVAGANLTSRIVPEFLTGRPTQSREDPQSQDHKNHASQDNSHNVQETTGPNATLDTLTRLADVLVGMNTKQFKQTLMVRPVRTTTLTFDGKSEKLKLIEDLFHTMIKI